MLRFVLLAIALFSPTVAFSQHMRGPRGGCYKVSASGRKTYVDRSMCGPSGPAKASPSGPQNYITGPRGGCYYVTPSGSKHYVDRLFCRN
jgi:hypothetical protein